MHNLCFGLIVMMGGALSAAEVIFGDNFRQNELGACLENAASPGGGAVLTTVAGVTGNVLKLTTPAVFKPVPANDRTKYQLVVRGRQQGVESIEENPRLSELIFNRRSFLPWRQLKFFDADRKELDSDLPALSLPFGQWHDYAWVFYPPMRAASMRVEINPGDAKGTTVSLADVKLDPAPDEQAINVNPTFSYGPYNYSGWSVFNVPGGVGRLYAIEGGKTVLYTGFSASTATFPLREPGTYRWYFRATNWERSRMAFLVFLDADGKEISRLGNRVTKPVKEMTLYFILPKGVARGYFLVYNNVLEELRLTRVGGAEKYKELTRAPSASK